MLEGEILVREGKTEAGLKDRILLWCAFQDIRLEETPQRQQRTAPSLAPPKAA
jgi:hypothetical protein